MPQAIADLTTPSNANQKRKTVLQKVSSQRIEVTPCGKYKLLLLPDDPTSELNGHIIEREIRDCQPVWLAIEKTHAPQLARGDGATARAPKSRRPGPFTCFRILVPEPGRIKVRAPRRPRRRRWHPSSPKRVPRPYWRLPISKNRRCAPWSPGTARR